MAGFPDIHVPPIVPSERSTLSPTHTVNAPVIAAGNGLVVNTISELHPVAVMIYEIIDVPALTGVTIPVRDPTDATAGRLLLQVPPGVDDVNATAAPTHDSNMPVGVAGSGFTVIDFTEKHPVGNV
jgi:hypothetical protein